MAPNTNICHIRNRMISHFSFHESVFVGSLLRICGETFPLVVGEYRNLAGLASSHWCQSLLCHFDTSPPPSPLTCLSASFSLFCLSRPNAPSPLTFSLSYHRSWSLFDQTLSTHNWLLTHSLPPVTVSPFILTTLGSLSYFVQLTSSF